MPNFSNTSAPRDFSDLIPKGTVAPMYARIKRGGYGDHGLLTLASTEKGQSAYLHLEITIADGSHKGRKFWTRLTVEGANHSAAPGAFPALFSGAVQRLLPSWWCTASFVTSISGTQRKLTATSLRLCSARARPPART